MSLVHGTWERRPAVRWEDGFLSGNGHHGTLVFGEPNDERVVVTHHTLVRPNGSEHARPPELAAGLPDLQDRLLAGELDAAERFTDGRDLLWVQPFHPAFQIRLRGTTATGEAPGYHRSVDFATGVTRTRYEGWDSEVFVSRADDVIVQRVTATDLDISLDHRLPGAPTASASARAPSSPPGAPCSPCAATTPAATAPTPASPSSRSPAAPPPSHRPGCGSPARSRCCC